MPTRWKIALSKTTTETNLISGLKQQVKTLTAQLKKTETKIDDVTAYFENIIALMPGHVYWLDKNNVFQGCNDKQAANANLKSRKDIVGKTNYDMPWKKQAHNLNALNNLVMRTGITQTGEEFAKMAEGSRTYLSHKVPLRNAQKEIVGTLGVSVDISETKELEQKLQIAKEAAEAANQAKTEFLANMSHDIRTPLSGIVGLAQMLGRLLEENEQKQYANLIHQSGEQLLSLLNHVLEVVSTDKLKDSDINKTSFNLKNCIDELIQLEMPSIQLKNLTLHVHYDEASPLYIVTDKAKLHRILLNLLSNAIKFTDHGVISLSIEPLKTNNNKLHLKFTVHDTGIGMKSSVQNKIFDRFYRANPAYEGKYDGCGVGLHIAQKYVSFLGGTLQFESKEDKGSRFFFTLPVKHGEKPKVEKHTAITNIPHQQKNRTTPLILIVEDNAVTLKIFESYAKTLKAKIKFVENGEAALKLMPLHNFDFLITDIGLPGISGYQLTEIMRDQEKTSKNKPIPIVGLTAHALRDARELCIASGMNDVINKPISLEKFQSLINQYCP